MSGEPADVEMLLTRLEKNLSEQLDLAQAAQFEALTDLVVEVDGLLARAIELLPTMCPDQQPRLERISQVHRQIGLILTERREALRQGMIRSARGRRALNAYRGS